MVSPDFPMRNRSIMALVALFCVFAVIGWFAPPLTAPADARATVGHCGVPNSGAKTPHTYNGSFQTNADVSEMVVNFSDSYVNSISAGDVSGTLNGTDIPIRNFKKDTKNRTLSITLDRSVAVNYSDNFTVRVNDVIHPAHPGDREVTVTFRNSTSAVDTFLFATTYTKATGTVHRPVSTELGTYTVMDTESAILGFTVPNSEREVPTITDSDIPIRTSDDTPVIRFQIGSETAKDAIREHADGEAEKEWVTEIIGEVNGEPVPVYVTEPSEYAADNLDSYITVTPEGNTSSVYYHGERVGSMDTVSVQIELDSGYVDRFRAYGWEMYFRDAAPSLASTIIIPN